MNPDELRRRFPNASKSCLAANADSAPDRAGAVADAELRAGEGALAAGKGATGATGRVHIRITAVRKRLCDADGVFSKWLVDCLRYAGIIRDDTTEDITLENKQRKAAKGEAEHTVIELFQ